MRFSARIDGTQRLRRKLRDLPRQERKYVTDAIEKGTRAVQATAKIVAPYRSGETRAMIENEIKDQGMTGIVFAGETREEKAKAYSVEFGRKKGNRGTTDPQPYMRASWAFHRKRVSAAIKRAVRKAVKSVATRG